MKNNEHILVTDIAKEMHLLTAEIEGEIFHFYMMYPNQIWEVHQTGKALDIWRRIYTKLTKTVKQHKTTAYIVIKLIKHEKSAFSRTSTTLRNILSEEEFVEKD